MTQYDEYLQYLKHVDDTTLQDFEKEKRKLQSELNQTLADAKKIMKKRLKASKINFQQKKQDTLRIQKK